MNVSVNVSVNVSSVQHGPRLSSNVSSDWMFGLKCPTAEGWGLIWWRSQWRWKLCGSVCSLDYMSGLVHTFWWGSPLITLMAALNPSPAQETRNLHQHLIQGPTHVGNSYSGSPLAFVYTWLCFHDLGLRESGIWPHTHRKAPHRDHHFPTSMYVHVCSCKSQSWWALN